MAVSHRDEGGAAVTDADALTGDPSGNAFV